MENNKKQVLFLSLAGIFLANALLAEMMGVKIFSAESTVGLSPANINILGYTLDFNLSAGVIIWPIVFIVTDIINEYFGKKGVKTISFLTVSCIAYAFFMLFVVTKLKPATFWLEINNEDADGHYFNIHFAFNKIYTQGLGIIVGSLMAFLMGQFIDVIAFQKLRSITGEKKIWLRATGSTLISQLVDSFVVLFIAFYALAPFEARWSLAQIISVGIINYIYKFVVAILMTPFIYLGHRIIDRYLGQDLAEKLKEKAAQAGFIDKN